MLTARAFDTHAEQLFERIRQLHAVLAGAGISYRIVGGVAVFFHVFDREPLRARFTSDIDVAIERSHLAAVMEASKKAGFDMLSDAAPPRARSAVHLLFFE